MTLTPAQFKDTLREVLRDEMPSQLKPLQTSVGELTSSVSNLAKEVHDLKQEFAVHRTRLTHVEQRLGITPR